MSDGSFVLRKYNIVEKLAVGGMAEIFLATSKEAHFQNKFYVIKRVLPTLATNAEYLAYLKDEAKALSLLQHNNIIGFQDFFVENEQFYLVMEYVSGKTLREIFSTLHKRNQSLSVEYILHVVMEVAAGLDHAHSSYDYILDKSLNLVHRDLNPQNIMISFRGQVKIIDFGISKSDIREDFTKTGMLKGKFGYMSPEQVEGIEIDSRTDVFALGIVLWELLANKRLFDGEDDFEKFDKIRNHQVASVCQHNSAVSKDLDNIVAKALAPKAADRYQSAAEFRHDLALYTAKQHPGFKPETFKRLIEKIFPEEFKKEIEKLRHHFHKIAVEEEEATRTSREFFSRQAIEENAQAARRMARDSSGPKIAVPENFELNVNKARLKLEVPNIQDEATVIKTPSASVDPQKKKVKKTKHTMLEPERYNVQVKNIEVSKFHAWINSYGPRMKALVYIFSFLGISWGLLVAYQQGILHTFLNEAYALYKVVRASL